MTEKIKILFLAANPLDSGRLQLDREVREIENRILMATRRDQFELIPQGAVTPDDLQRALLRHKPHIVHFSGHGSKKRGIVVEGQPGKSQMISKPDLTDLFEILKDNISVIVLSACYSGIQADRLYKVFDYTIVVQTAISDNTAINFAAGFYQGLAHGCSVKKAFDLAINLLKMKGVAKGKLPELFIREGVDSNKPLLEQAPAPVTQSSLKPYLEPIVPPLPWKDSYSSTISNRDFILRIVRTIIGIILIIGLYFIGTYINSNMEKESRRQRYEEAMNQVNSQTSVIGRVTAIDNLGKLTSDPDFNDYYEPIINALVIFIRENSKLKKTGSVQQNEKSSEDIQAALKVLGWRKRKWGDEGESQRLNLSDTYLRRADLKHGTEPEVAHLEGALLINADLERAMLREVNLENAILRGANLRNATLYKANLQGADLFGADLEGADLQWATGLTVKQIKLAKKWEKAIFTQEFEDALRATN